MVNSHKPKAKGPFSALVLALFCILGISGSIGRASIHRNVLARLNEEMFQRVEPALFSAFEKPVHATDVALDFRAQDALMDPQNRISDEFKVPTELKERVQFWFDIYTRYGENHHVVHHVRYPWIIFDVVDTGPILEQAGVHKWTKYHQAKKLVADRKTAVRRALVSLSKRSKFNRLTGMERKVFDALTPLPGKRRNVIRLALANVRSQLGQRDFIIKGLNYSSKYLPYMEEEFRAAGLPTELTRIPFLESSFNPYAESKVGASGIWQIMPRTGRAFVIVNDHVDERNSPLKASMVAVEILKANYRALKDWPLAVTAYNHGVGGIKAALRKSRSTTLLQLIAKVHQGSFKFASANFYTSFLAILHAEKYHKEILRDHQFDRELPLRYSVYELSKKMRARQLQKIVGILPEDFVGFNMDLKHALKSNAWVPRGFKVLVPFERRYELDAKTGLGLKPVREASNESENSSLTDS